MRHAGVEETTKRADAKVRNIKGGIRGTKPFVEGEGKEVKNFAMPFVAATDAESKCGKAYPARAT